MAVRFTYPVLLSLAGLLFFLLPIVPANHATDHISNAAYAGSNIIYFNLNDLKIDETTTVQAEVTHSTDLFCLTLWIGNGRENRITFILKNEDIKETAYELDHPSKRYFSFLYHGKHCTYSSDDSQTGMLMIHKYDTVNKIIAGSFEFMAWSDGCDELVRLNNGQFDATYTLHQELFYNQHVDLTQ